MSDSFPIIQRPNLRNSGILVEILDNPITLRELNLSLLNCKCKKSPGPDNISYEFLKNIPEGPLNFLLDIYNNMLIEEKLPSEWTKILLKMIYKMGEKMDPNNYRPIALADTLLKVFTSILNKRLSIFSENNRIIPEFQSGFREGRSCTDNIYTLNSLIQLKLRKENGKLFALFVDF